MPATIRIAVIGCAIAIAAPVRAQPKSGPPVVDVADLPPLPPRGERTRSATLLAAADAEEDVVVGAAKREQSLGNVASAVTVISGDRLRRFGYRTVSEALRAVAGVHVADDHVTERVGIRGLQILGDFNTRILVLVDGASLNELWGAFAGVGWDMPISIDDVARIEVIRGPVSSVYGTNAFFGIINIITRGAAESPKAWGRMGGSTFRAGQFAAGFASGDVDRQIRGSVGGLLRGGEVLDAQPIGSDLENDGAKSIAASVVGAYDGAFGQIRFYHRDREMPYAPYDSVTNDERVSQTDTLGVVEGGYTREVGERLVLGGRGYVNAYRFTDYLVNTTDMMPFRDFGDALWYGAEARARYAILDDDRLGITGGGELTFANTESRSFYIGMEDLGVEVPKDFNLQGLYAEVDAAPMKYVALTAGARLDRNSVLEDRISPRAALFFADEDRYGAKFLYAEGFRNPSAYEAFFADGADFVDNPLLAAETIRSFEGVLWGRPMAGLSLRLSGFRWRADGLVEQEEVDTPDGPRLQFQNVGSAITLGFEAEATYRDSRGWFAFAGGTVAKIRTEDDLRIAGAPAVTTAFGVSTPLLRDLGHVSTEVAIVGPRETRDPGVEAPTFVGWGLALYAPDLRKLDVTIGVRNIVGKRERVPAPEDFDRSVPDVTIVPVLPGEGREFYARLGYRFD